MRRARAAGTAAATSVTTIRIMATPANVNGSAGVTSKSSPSMNRPSHTAPSSPTAMPKAESASALRITAHRTVADDAPSASWIAISRVRRTTANETTP